MKSPPSKTNPHPMTPPISSNTKGIKNSPHPPPNNPLTPTHNPIAKANYFLLKQNPSTNPINC